MGCLSAVLTTEVGAVPFWQRIVSLVGLFAMVGIAWLLSKHRDRVPWRVIGWGIGLQVSFGILVMKTDVGLRLFSLLNDMVIALLGFTAQGTEFIFGDFASEKFTIAINVLPTIIFFSSLMTILYYLGIMQRLVGMFAWVMRRTMRTSGSETLSAAANSFVGQTEAPLMIAPFIRTMTTSELMAVMTGGFATVAGGVLAAYVGLLKDVFPDIAGHLIAASVMSAPAALVIAKVMWPETEGSDTAGEVTLEIDNPDVNVIDAAARGAYEGMKLALNVGAMLLAFIALIALTNALLGMPFELYNDWAGLEGAAACRGGGATHATADPRMDLLALRVSDRSARCRVRYRGNASWREARSHRVHRVSAPLRVAIGRGCTAVATYRRHR
jgi:CNT family concentrative nucleoside transporter